MTLNEPYHFLDWFTFEGRCFLCGAVISVNGSYYVHHLDRHCREGYLTHDGVIYTQVKEHPTGFPKSPYDK